MPHRFNALFTHTQDAVAVADGDGVILRVNPAADVRFRLAAEAAHLRDLLAEPGEWDAIRAEVAAEGQVCRRPVRLRSSGGAAEQGLITCLELQIAGGGSQLQTIVHAPVGEAAEALHARFDAATGLPNRAGLVTQLERALADEERRGGVALIQVDLNRFQRVNETLGHDSGNALLSTAAQRLDACVRPGDVVARSEGDDFLVLLNGVADEAAALRVADRIARALAGGYNLRGQEVFCGSDVGVAMAAPGTRDPEPLLRAVQAAMSAARQTGTVQVFRPDMHTESMAALRLDADLRYALPRDELRVFYQPIVNLSDGTVSGFEALVRWIHPVRGLVAPAEFIPVAEETGLIVPIGEWVLHQAAAQLRDWQARYPANPPLAMGINLSVRQFRPALVDEVRAVLDQSGVDAAGLKLEVTESVVMGSTEDAITVLDQLKTLGVKLQVDDFGTGYSSLSYLHRLPIDILKIDRSFIVAMGGGGKHLAIVRAIIALAEALGLETTAEGVDSTEQAENLRDMRCTYGQGYLWSRPVPAEEAEALLTRRPVTASAG